ncbi:MAG: hypothetical protein U0794_19180 [Isosphaeraceae bacterium]
MASIVRSLPEHAPGFVRSRRSDLDRRARSGTSARWFRFFVGLFVLVSFFPYPAITVGSNNGLQFGQILAFAAVVGLVCRPPDRSFFALLALLGPLYLSAFLNSCRATTVEPSVLLKEAIATTSSLWILWPAGWLATHARFRDALTLAALATIVHALLGLYQMHAFANEEFPLLWLYRNPSFKDMAEWAPIYARYIQRPCGLFPEPSAMAAALGPWLVLLVGRLAGKLPGLGMSRREAWITALAVIGGFFLMAVSRSGSVVAVIGGALLALLGRSGSSNRQRGLTLLALVVASLGVVGFVAAQVSSSLDERIESSWGLRGQSIVAAMTGNTEPLTLVFGIGAGQSSPAIKRLMSGVAITEEQGEVAVWSLAASYYMDNGLVGGVALAVVLGAAVRAVLNSAAVAMGLGALLAWLVAVTVTTSYLALPPVWLFLGVALSWNRVFPRSHRRGSRAV